MDRDEVIAGLREAADFLERHPDVKVSYSHYNVLDACIYVTDVAEMATQARALGRVHKNYTGEVASVERVVGGVVRLGALASRKNVCERVVVGTRKVERSITEAIGTEVVTEEIVEWRCEPLLPVETAVS